MDVNGRKMQVEVFSEVRLMLLIFFLAIISLAGQEQGILFKFI